MAIFRLGLDWLALPAVDVASLHWRGLVLQHCEPETGLAFLRHARQLVPLLDALALAGRRRRQAPEFVLVIKRGRSSGSPPFAGLLVDEFGEISRLHAAPTGPATSGVWWSPYQDPARPGMLATSRGPVPILVAERLVCAAPQWAGRSTSC